MSKRLQQLEVMEELDRELEIIASLNPTESSKNDLSFSEELYDIVLVGRSGKGKSTLGNKLLQVSYDKDKGIGFCTADNIEGNDGMFKVTENCEVRLNEATMVRVLDTPGFSDSYESFSQNEETFREILFQHLQQKMTINRFLYFLPKTGIPNKADRAFQDELKVMYHFLGDTVLYCMVLIATQDQEYQENEFTDAHCNMVQKVFCAAFEKATGSECTVCPPVVYIGINDSADTVMKKIQVAPVIKSGFVVPGFQVRMCSSCKTEVHFIQETGAQIGVVEENSDLKICNESKCHVNFIPKYGRAKRLIGSFFRLCSLGFYTPSWNSQRICQNCKMPPASPPGCHDVMKYFDGSGEKVTHKFTN